MEERTIEKLLGDYGASISARPGVSMRVRKAVRRRRSLWNAGAGLASLMLLAGGYSVFSPAMKARRQYNAVREALEHVRSFHAVSQVGGRQGNAGEAWLSDGRVRVDGMSNIAIKEPGQDEIIYSRADGLTFRDEDAPDEALWKVGAKLLDDALCFSQDTDATGMPVAQKSLEVRTDPMTGDQVLTIEKMNGVRTELFLPAGSELPTRVVRSLPNTSDPSTRVSTVYQYNVPVDPKVFHPKEMGVPIDVSAVRKELRRQWARPLVGTSIRGQSCEIYDLCQTSDGTVFAVYSNLMHAYEGVPLIPVGLKGAGGREWVRVWDLNLDLGSQWRGKDEGPKNLPVAIWASLEPLHDGETPTKMGFALSSSYRQNDDPVPVDQWMDAHVTKVSGARPDFSDAFRLGWALQNLPASTERARAVGWMQKGNLAKAYSHQMKAYELSQSRNPQTAYRDLKRVCTILELQGKTSEAAKLRASAHAAYLKDPTHLPKE